MDYVNAFWVGGLICALCQILMEKTKMQPGRIMVLLVCSGAVLGAIGVNMRNPPDHTIFLIICETAPPDNQKNARVLRHGRL